MRAKRRAVVVSAQTRHHQICYLLDKLSIVVVIAVLTHINLTPLLTKEGWHRESDAGVVLSLTLIKLHYKRNNITIHSPLILHLNIIDLGDAFFVPRFGKLGAQKSGHDI